VGDDPFRSKFAALVAFTGRWTRVPSETTGVRVDALDVRVAFASSRWSASASQTAESALRGGQACPDCDSLQQGESEAGLDDRVVHGYGGRMRHARRCLGIGMPGDGTLSVRSGAETSRIETLICRNRSC